MSFENKKPSFKERLEGKKLIKYVVAAMGGIGLISGILYVAMDGGEEKKEENIDYTSKLKYANSNDQDQKINSLIGVKANASDPYASIVDPTLSSVISGNSTQQTQNDLLIGPSSTPLYSTDDRFAYKDGFDYKNATNEQLRAKITEEEGKKIVKVGSIQMLDADTDFAPSWRDKEFQQKNSLNPSNQTQTTSLVGSSKGGNNLPLMYDSNGKQILGYDASGNPIIGYDANGKPILGVLPKGSNIAGYDSNGKAITKQEFAENLTKGDGSLKQNTYDKNGRLIVGYDKNGNPIIGYDANGKPILGILGQGVDGYDANGKPINQSLDKLFQKCEIKLFDKNGKLIIGFTENNKPSLGNDKGATQFATVDKGVAGYDANGKAISENLLSTICVQKQVLGNLSKGLIDADGNPIIGFDASGNPIIGFDKSGKPIMGRADKGVAGYDANGKPILKQDLQQFLKKNATDNILAKSGKPSLYDKNGNLVLGFDSKGHPIIGFDSNGKPILGTVDKGIAGYDANGNPIKKDQLANFYNNKFNSLDAVASIGTPDKNSSVPPISGYQPGEQTISIQPQATGVNVKQIQQQQQFIKARESNPWDEAVSKTNDDADKAKLDLSLNYKKDESATSSQPSQNVAGAVAPTQIVSENSKKPDLGGSDGKLNTPMLPETVYNKYTVKKGSFIPMIMQTGINSDLPGSIIGKVSQNVYDSATGKYLLIPQGSTLLGSYSANVTYGQERIMIAWNSLIYPDASEISIQGQPGTDLAGFSGLNDQVNNHYWTLFGNTFLLSVLTAGLEYNQQGSSNSANNGSSFSSSLSNSSGQMMGQAAAGVIQKALNIAPTLTVRNGFRGNILLTQDLALPSPYKVKMYNPSN